MKLRIHNGARHLGSQIMVNGSALPVYVLFQVATIAHGSLLSLRFLVVLLFQRALLRQPVLLGQEFRFALSFCSCGSGGGGGGSSLLGGANIWNSSYGGILAGRRWRRFRTRTGFSASSGRCLGAGCSWPAFRFPCASQLNICAVLAKLHVSCGGCSSRCKFCGCGSGFGRLLGGSSRRATNP